MTNKHPIAPPPEMVKQWALDKAYDECDWLYELHIATQAAQWGADQELEACCEWFVRDWTDIETADNLRAARRSNPPNLKEQALAALEVIPKLVGFESERDAIRRALEVLPE